MKILDVSIVAQSDDVLFFDLKTEKTSFLGLKKTNWLKCSLYLKSSKQGGNIYDLTNVKTLYHNLINYKEFNAVLSIVEKALILDKKELIVTKSYR